MITTEFDHDPTNDDHALEEPPVILDLGEITELTLGHQFNDTRDTKRTERW